MNLSDQTTSPIQQKTSHSKNVRFLRFHSINLYLIGFCYRHLTTGGRIFKQWQQQELNPWAVLMKSRDSIGKAALPANKLFLLTDKYLFSLSWNLTNLISIFHFICQNTTWQRTERYRVLKKKYMYICRSCHGNLCDLIKDKLLCKEFYLVKDITIFLNTCIK